MTELLVIRHGETDWNRQHRFQGQIDVPLNALGLAQAERLGQRLRDEPLDLIITSDLSRARSTAEAVARQHHGAAALQPLPEALWREQGFGVLEGLDLGDIQARHPGLWTQWLRHEADYALPGGGESNVMFHARVMRALQALLAAHAGQRVAVVCHGGVLDMLWRTAQGQSLGGPRRCEIPNTGINRLRWQGEALHIVQWADAEHLAGLPAQPSTAQTLHPEEP
ncbi:histidine phosphatase family protein [Aquabacterium sp. OR-4]|uniref:histidine phosphatase family protein n=1 Tax=Aquabacterium sp. OR-4 TaxID=2978127 RepID=UPI0021B44774|nr:histidine phosphatase family protein [Aquabacterium sp. OR-4]MDT7834000.1 histidine phosphatase family protein [Aquabacterium sp. OR-4]